MDTELLTRQPLGVVMDTVELLSRDLLGPDRIDRPAADEPCTAEVADCTCPDFCERDHANE